MVADSSVALIGGRNIGNEYFQIDPELQVADDDVLAAGPIVATLSVTFDEFWNSALAILAAALVHERAAAADLAEHREQEDERPAEKLQTLETDGVEYGARIATGEPYAGMVSARLPLVWARAHVVSDSAD